MRKPSLLVIFLTVFIDLIGFGIVVPLLPVYSKHLVPQCIPQPALQGVAIGLIIASFSAMQFFFAPVLGRLSDRHGRRPVLLLSTAGAAVSYALFALSAYLAVPAAALGLMVASRMFAGLCGGNITVAQAYIADISAPSERSKRMGLIGMAFGLGFIFGPVIGGLALKHMGTAGPGWIAAGLCAANFILAFFVLPESRQPGTAPGPERPHMDQWRHTLSEPKIGLLIVVFFLATFCFSSFESTLAIMVSDHFHLDIETDEKAAGTTAAVLFVFCGLIGAFVQGGLIGRMVKRMGEPKLIALSLVLTAISLAMLPFITGNGPISWGVLWQPAGRGWWFMLAALALLALGSGLTRPPLFGMLSNLAPANEQGATIGVAQGSGSLARILGPIFASTLLHFSAPALYLICAVVLLITAALVAQRLAPGYHPPGTAADPAK